MLPPQLLYICLKQYRLNLEEAYQQIVLEHTNRNLMLEENCISGFDELIEDASQVSYNVSKEQCLENRILLSTSTVYDTLLNYYLVQADRNPVLYKKI
jgi:hypothetical protein